MFKYRLLTGYKLPGSNLIRRYAKLIVLYSFIFAVLIIIIQWLRISKLSAYKDLGEAKADALNNAWNQLPVVEETRDTWKVPRVDGAAIFSAYLDTRQEVVLEEDSSLVINKTAWAMIRIIGVIPVKLSSSSLMCYYRYRNKVRPEETSTLGKRATAVHLVAFGENFGMEYCAAFILCELPGREDVKEIQLPQEVTITSEIQDRPSDLSDEEFVIVRYPKNGWRKNSEKNTIKNPDINSEKNSDINSDKNSYKNSEKHSVAVCVQPFHHNFNKAVDLVAFVEFYRIMGVTRFTFYKDSYTPEVNEILKYYARNNVATVLEWHLPDIYFFEINLRVDGIFAALNDCLYRSTFHDSYRYVAGVDIDEYIVPRKHENFEQLMEYLNPKTTGYQGVPNGAWIFRNMFFYLMHQDDSSTLAPGLPRLKLHTKTLRWREVNPPRDRSKFIVQGRDVIDLGNHRVWKMKRAWSIFGRRYKQVAVDPEVAGSQHYRKCETNVEKCWKRETTLDQTAHRFTERLAERVAYVMKEVFPPPKTSPLDKYNREEK